MTRFGSATRGKTYDVTETGFTYPEVGASQREPLPSGYRHLRYRTRLGDSRVFGRAAEAILTFQMQRGPGVQASGGRAAPGVRVVVGRGPLRAPCEVVYVIEEPDRAGYAYGTLPGHPARGEESFLALRDPDGTVWLEITSFSVPAGWPMRALGPAARLGQHAYARLCAHTLRRRLAKLVP